MRRPGGRSARRLILLAAGSLLVLLALAQLVLPRIAAALIRSRIARYGSVQSVSVSAWPAIKLLWGSADSVTVRAGALTISEQHAGSLLDEARQTNDIDFSARSVTVGDLTVDAVSVRKRGSQLQAHALVDETEVKHALPSGVSVQLARSSGGEVEVRVDGSLFGFDASMDAVAKASDGKLVVKPTGALLSGFELTLLEDPRIHVESVGAAVHTSEPRVYAVTMSATLR